MTVRQRVLAVIAVLMLVVGAGGIGWYVHPAVVVRSTSMAPPIAPVTALAPIPVEGQATLPASNQEPEIKDLKMWQTAYTVPWAMWEDTKRRAWLNPEYTVTKDPEGTSHMAIRRELGGYHVWISPDDVEERYSPEITPAYAGSSGSWIPVRRLTLCQASCP